jgi:hypothetical protein
MECGIEEAEPACAQRQQLLRFIDYSMIVPHFGISTPVAHNKLFKTKPLVDSVFWAVVCCKTLF